MPILFHFLANHQSRYQDTSRMGLSTWFAYNTIHMYSGITSGIPKCFPPTNKLHKILNRNTVKISYRCMPNMKQIISNHNKTILNKDSNTESKTSNCSCRIKEACPVNQKCQTSILIHQATVTRHDNNKEESYIGLTDNTFKARYNGHTSSFQNEQYRNATNLSNYIWTLKHKKHKLLTKMENHRQRKGLSALRGKLWPLWLRKILHNIKTRTSKLKSEKWTRYLLQT